jgi:hypothetical protein
MNVVNAFIFFLACYGCAWIIAYGKITLPLRQYFYDNKDSVLCFFLYELTKCPVCTSWWIALFTLFTGFPQEVFNYQYSAMYTYLPFAVSGLTSLIIDLNSEE